MYAHGLHEILDAADVMLRGICASEVEGLFWEAGSHFKNLFGKDWIIPVAYFWNWRTAPEYRSMSPYAKQILLIKICMKTSGLEDLIFPSPFLKPWEDTVFCMRSENLIVA